MPITSESIFDADITLNFMHIIEKLKQLKRQGWLDHRISSESCESVSDHSYRMAMMCFTMGPADCDQFKLLKMCLVHDLAEALAGDITPEAISGVTVADKHDLERESLQKIVKDLPKGTQDEMITLWSEYDAGESYISKIAKQFDKLEMMVQALEYKKRGLGIELDSFMGVDEAIMTHEPCAKLYRRIKELWKSA
ncbi:5'-deoxynucleotidase YfbR/HDDC2 like protein [Aduncisulcus paluster]|uniref:5'-deoxynucleotidase n=1 Tax=Aduncisulcus paluster TaxID=2918883 RepID=A0ABQ5JZ73_9EUKA|nr:5'-deoxynucleotidase YfbR/HDDC2 like protein [Aduncisulcus paluster]